MYDPSFPRMLNCIVPRAHLLALKRRFGSVFDSVAPDWNFCFRTLASVDSVLFYHKAVLIHYAADKSNGASQARGLKNEAFADFMKNLGAGGLSAHAPYSQIPLVWNTVISEYCLVRSMPNVDVFPPVEMDRYVLALAQSIRAVEDPELRDRMSAVLAAHASLPSIADDPQPVRQRSPGTRSGTFNRLCHSAAKLVNRLRYSPSLWGVLSRAGFHPPNDVTLTFSNSRQALRHLATHPLFAETHWRDGLPPVELAGGAKLAFALADEPRSEWTVIKLKRRLDTYPWWQAFSRAMERHVLWRFM